MYWMGIDVGTGGTRALLVDAKGRVHAGFTAPHEDMHMERPLWAEQRPENWWDACQTAVRGVLEATGVAGKNVSGVGLSGQMHGLVLLDAAGAVIRPALIWCDQRSQEQVDFVNRKVGRERSSSTPRILYLLDSPCPSYFGCAITSRNSSHVRARSFCPKTTFASG